MTSSESSLDTRALASLEEKLNSGREKNWASQVYDDDEGSIGKSLQLLLASRLLSLLLFL